MMHWHRCRRWWRHGLECPFNSLVDHEDDDEEDGDPDLIKIPVPARRKRDKSEADVTTGGGKVGSNITDRELEELGEAQKIRIAIGGPEKKAEEVVREAPRPIPRILEPVGDLFDLLPPPPPIRGSVRAPARTPARARVRSPALTGALGTTAPVRRPTPKVVGLAAALTMNQLSRLHPRLPPPHRKPQLALDEEVIVQELVDAPQPSGFGFKAKQVGFIVGGAAAGIGAAFALGGRGGGGGGSFAFNAAARLRGQLTTGAFP